MNSNLEMAPLSPQDDNRSSFERVLDEAAANAPELDNDLVAPEHRGDNVPPEVSMRIYERNIVILTWDLDELRSRKTDVLRHLSTRSCQIFVKH